VQRISGSAIALLSVGLALTLAAYGDSPVEPGSKPIDPGPTNVVLAGVTELANNDLRTSLRNDGGPGSYKLAFFGWDPYAPCNGCTRYNPVGETSPITINAGYAETLTWDSGTYLHFTRLIVYSRPNNTAVWTETDRWQAP